MNHNWKKKINAISKQVKGGTNGITSQEWNFIINSLAEQTNNNTIGVSESFYLIEKLEGFVKNLINGDDIGDGATYKLVSEAEKNTWNDKQDKLIAGSNITIDENTNVISSSGGSSIIISETIPINGDNHKLWIKPGEDVSEGEVMEPPAPISLEGFQEEGVEGEDLEVFQEEVPEEIELEPLE